MHSYRYFIQLIYEVLLQLFTFAHKTVDIVLPFVDGAEEKFVGTV